jgi:HK97 family phage major capsid protein/HK97 family phage prohead protease
MEKISCFKSISLVKTAKSPSGGYLIQGYANVYDVIDKHHDIIKRSAFSDIENCDVKFLWQHMTDKPIGKILRLFSDQKGLFIEADLDTNLVQGYEAARLVESGIIDGLSIGFEILEHFYENGMRVITKAKLWEVSIVTFPANELSIINNSNTLEDQMLEKSFEDRLNDVEKIINRPTLNYSNTDFAMKSFIRSGDATMLQTKAALTSENERAGYTIPAEFNKKILGAMEVISPMRKLCSIETISSNVLELLIEDTKFSCGWVAEAGERAETDSGRILKKQIHIHELYAQPKATQRLLDDEEVNIENWLLEKLRDSFAKAENESFITGNGNGKPRGILTYGGDIQVVKSRESDQGGFDFDDLLSLINALPDQYSRNTSFLMHRSTLTHIRKLKDATGRFIWQPSAVIGQPDTIFGIPVYSCEEMPIMERNSTPVALADFKSTYKIVDRRDISMMRDPYTEKPFVKFYATKRVGGDVVNANAIKLLGM